ncbi:succinyldiaminopimelate transaminase [Conyzicola sp.]|uniref:succinyldiaminopimelate transaminase n=1 Tax=Conyzicola sp. TaxID=1969404 RepID=UPI00398A2053
MTRTPLSLPDFPWDALVPFGARARLHPGGIIDLSVGSPVDPTPALIREALTAATDAHAYPQVAGTPALREAIVEWYGRRRGVHGLGTADVLPSIGSKELIAWLPLMLGIGEGDIVVHPRVAYPTYAIGAALAKATALASDDPAEWPQNTKLVWINSPGNPDGRVLDVETMRTMVARARELGAVIAGDECYAELNWASDEPTPSILDPRVVGGDRTSVLSVYSLSKQSNLAGYRAGFVAGDTGLIAELLGVRKHAGLIPPAPVQAAMIVALGDEQHVDVQRELYRSRRDRLKAAVEAAGFAVDHSEAGLYLWAARGQDAWQTVAELADLGLLVVPGTFYTDGAPQHVRIALTVSDDDIDSAVERLAQLR